METDRAALRLVQTGTSGYSGGACVPVIVRLDAVRLLSLGAYAPVLGGMSWPAPTGRHFQIDWMDVIRFRGDKMVEHWGVADRLGMLEELGLAFDSVRPWA